MKKGKGHPVLKAHEVLQEPIARPVTILRMKEKEYVSSLPILSRHYDRWEIARGTGSLFVLTILLWWGEGQFPRDYFTIDRAQIAAV